MNKDFRELHWLRLWLLLGRIAIAAIVVLSLIKLSTLPPVKIQNLDKWEHVLAYFLLTAWYAQLCATRAAVLKRAAGFLLLGIAIEYAQSLTTYRSMDRYDALADLGGIVLGAGIWWTPMKDLLARLERRWAAQAE